MTQQSAAPAHQKSARVMTVEFWRFFFAVLVCWYHLEIYLGKQTILPSGSSAVEFFFVLAGFTIAMSARRSLAGRTQPVTVREAHAKALDYVKSKLKAIYPVLIVVMLLMLVIPPIMQSGSALHTALNSEWEWLMLVGTPFGTMQGKVPLIPLWFLTVLLVCGYIYTFAVYKNYDFMKFAAPVLGVLFYIYFALNAQKTLDFYIPMGFLNAGMVRGFAEMALGMSMFYMYEYISRKKLGILWKILLTLLELYAIYRFFSLALYQPLGPDNYRRDVYILIIVLLSFVNLDFVTRGLGKLGPLWKRAGALSMTMYLCHIPVINLYFYLLRTVKTALMMKGMSSPFAKSMSDFLKDTGGFSGGKMNPMSWKDMGIFIVMVIITSILITLLIAAVKKFVAKPLYTRYKAKQVEKETAGVS